MIRPAAPRDIPAIMAIWNPIIESTSITFTTTLKTAESLAADLAAKAAANHPFLVVEEGGEAKGFATYGTFRSGPGYARTMEHTIILGQEARGKGAGRQLIEALCTHARAQGIHSLIGGVSAENADGIAFHARVGFAEIARLPEVGYKFNRWMGLVLMQRML